MAKKLLIWIMGCLCAFNAYASIMEIQAEKDISELYHKLSEKKNFSTEQRIDWIGQQFLNKPYLLGALGEGSDARYDQFPLYRTDAFDCETYVDTVLALSMAHNFQDFKAWMLKIRYAHGKADYIYRNHFTDLEWNKNNQNLGLLEDITEQIGKSDTAFAKTMIDKKNWYLKTPETAIRLQHPTPENIKKQHDDLVSKNTLFSEYPISTPYIPLSVLFDKNQQPRMQFFKQIPQNAVVEIVRPNWNLKDVIGTNLNISHMGFAIWKDGTLYFRNASQIVGKVVDIPMVEYLKETLSSPTIKGINVQKVTVDP